MNFGVNNIRISDASTGQLIEKRDSILLKISDSARQEYIFDFYNKTFGDRHSCSAMPDKEVCIIDRQRIIDFNLVVKTKNGEIAPSFENKKLYACIIFEKEEKLCITFVFKGCYPVTINAIINANSSLIMCFDKNKSCTIDSRGSIGLYRPKSISSSRIVVD